MLRTVITNTLAHFVQYFDAIAAQRNWKTMPMFLCKEGYDFSWSSICITKCVGVSGLRRNQKSMQSFCLIWNFLNDNGISANWMGAYYLKNGKILGS